MYVISINQKLMCPIHFQFLEIVLIASFLVASVLFLSVLLVLSFSLRYFSHEDLFIFQLIISFSLRDTFSKMNNDTRKIKVCCWV
jgi:hypothetical protein